MSSPGVAGRLHVITDETVQSRFSHVQIATMARDGGADVVQFREKREWETPRRLEIAHVVIPKANAGDLDKIPGYVREALSIHAVDSADDALDRALQQIIVPKPEETSAIELAISETTQDPPNTATG